MARDSIAVKRLKEAPVPRDRTSIRALRFRESEMSALFKTMKERQIYIVGGQRQRLSANIYTRPSDIDAFFEVCDQHLKR